MLLGFRTCGLGDFGVGGGDGEEDRCAKGLSLLSPWLSVGAKSADARTLGAVDDVGLEVLTVFVMLVEPKAVLVDVSLEALKRLLAVDIGCVNLGTSWLIEVVALVSDPPFGVEEHVPNPVTLCEGLLFVDVAAVPKTEPVVVEEEGCTIAGELPVAVVLGI